MEKQDCLTIFGDRIRYLRTQVGLSQESLAEKAGIDRSYLGGVERGEHNLALINILKIAKGLNISPESLFEPFNNKHHTG